MNFVKLFFKMYLQALKNQAIAYAIFAVAFIGFGFVLQIIEKIKETKTIETVEQ